MTNINKIILFLIEILIISGCSLEISKTGKAYGGDSLMNSIEQGMFKNGVFDGYVVVGKSAPAIDAVTASTVLLKLNDALGDPEEIPTNIDYSRTDGEVAIGSKNLIIVGTPCDNKLIRELLKISKCDDFFSEDITYINYYSIGGHNVLLITGKESSTIRANAIKVFSNPNNYNLRYPAIIHNLNNIEFKEYVAPEPKEVTNDEPQVEEQEIIEEEPTGTQKTGEEVEQQEPVVSHEEQEVINEPKKENIFEMVIGWFRSFF